MNAPNASNPDGPPLLEVRGVTKRFGATVALDGVDLVVHAGSIHAVVGENGAGKSTLMKVLSGAHHADEGSVALRGGDYHPAGPLAARRAGVAMIYQELALAPDLTVEQNILLGMEPVTAVGVVRGGEQRRKAVDALRQLGHGDIDPAARAGSLSIAQRQIVEIARALAVGCDLLILDEPTSSLNRPDIERLFRLLHRLRERGMGIIYISHFLEEVTEVADTYTVLRDGRTVATGAIADTTAADLARYMVGREMQDLYDRHPHTPGETLLEINGLSGTRKPRDASITVHRGEVVGIAGLVGAGRTELIRAVFGLDPVASGRIRLGVHAGPASPALRWAQSCGCVSEDRKEEGLAVELSLAENITLSHLPAIVRGGDQNDAARRWIDRLDIRCSGPSQQVVNLSGGNQQKAALARLLHHNVDLWLLDEPTRGIDIASKAHIYRLIDQLVRGEDGHPPRGVLLVSSYLPELLGVCDRIAVMHRGTLGPALPAAELDEHRLMLRATGQAVAP